MIDEGGQAAISSDRPSAHLRLLPRLPDGALASAPTVLNGQSDIGKASDTSQNRAGSQEAPSAEMPGRVPGLLCFHFP